MGLVEILLGVGFGACLAVALAVAPSATSSTEFWVARGFFVLAALMLVAAFLVWLAKSSEKPAIPDGLKVTIGAFLLIIIAAGLPMAWSWVNFRESLAPKAEASVSSPLDRAVRLECELMSPPSHFPPTGKVNFIQIDEPFTPQNEPYLGIQLEVAHYEGSSAILQLPWKKNIYKCTLTNYGKSPVLNAWAEWSAEFRNYKDNKYFLGEWTPIRSGKLFFPLLNLSDSVGNSATFYVVNTSKYVAYVHYPQTIHAQMIGAPSANLVRLIPPEYDQDGFVIPPTSPPAAPPPTPGPPESPEEK